MIACTEKADKCIGHSLESLASSVLLHCPHIYQDLPSYSNDAKQFPYRLYPPFLVRHVMYDLEVKIRIENVSINHQA
jgi:hypothetical protein